MATTRTGVPADPDLAVERGGSTTDDLAVDVPRACRGRAARRALLVVFTIFVVLGLLGLLGVRSGTARDTSGGVELVVTYARITRPGLASPFRIEVRSPDPLPATIEVSVDHDYLEIFDENGLDPDPADTTSDGATVTWSMQPDAGSTSMTVVLDARIEPAVQWRRGGAVRVRGTGLPELRVEFTTIVLP